MQLKELHKEIDNLQKKFGANGLSSVYGAGCIKKPKIMMIFMNPTGRNVSANPNWSGIRAPWLGTKNVWRMLKELNIISDTTCKYINSFRSNDWTENFAEKVYKEIENNKIYITNLAKCTQKDARPLPNRVFNEYLKSIYKEISLIKPKYIVTFGNQVSSILLGKNISVSKYTKDISETLEIFGQHFRIYPTYYPVGQGQRNLPLATKRIKTILSLKDV